MGLYEFIAQVWGYSVYFFWTQWVDTEALPPAPELHEVSSDLVSSFDSTGYDPESSDTGSEPVATVSEPDVSTVPSGALEVEDGNIATQQHPTTQLCNCDWSKWIGIIFRAVLSMATGAFVAVLIWLAVKQHLESPFGHGKETKSFKVENPALEVFQLSPDGNLKTHFRYTVVGPRSYNLSTILATDGLFLSEESTLTDPIRRSVGIFAWNADIERNVELSVDQLKSLLFQIRRGTLELHVQIVVNQSRITTCPLQVTLLDKVTKTLPCY